MLSDGGSERQAKRRRLVWRGETGTRREYAAVLTAGVLGAVAGLVAFGLLTDALDSFATAAVVVCAPVILASLLFARLPETRGLDLEQSAPD